LTRGCPHPHLARTGGSSMADLVFVALTALFFGIAVLTLKAVEKL
jgi:hypothetical protein